MSIIHENFYRAFRIKQICTSPLSSPSTCGGDCSYCKYNSYPSITKDNLLKLICLYNKSIKTQKFIIPVDLDSLEELVLQSFTETFSNNRSIVTKVQLIVENR